MIPYGKHFIDAQDIESVINVLKSSSLTQGPKISDFENSVASYVDAKYAIAVSSGTAALHLATIASGITAEHTLITSALTFVSSANVARFENANVEFCDIDNSSLNMSIESLDTVLTNNRNTKVIIPVHFAGVPCDVKQIKDLLPSNDDIYIIEDAAHALGSTYRNGNKVGCCDNSDMTDFCCNELRSFEKHHNAGW